MRSFVFPSILILVASTSFSVEAFNLPQAFVLSSPLVSFLDHTSTSNINNIVTQEKLFDGADQLTLPSTVVSKTAATSSIFDGASSVMVAGAFDIIRNILLAITAILFLVAGLTYLYAGFIIPQAAAELEKECKELAPDLWVEYESKLNEGESIGQRPELMMELGSKLQPLIERKVAAQEAGGEAPTAEVIQEGSFASPASPPVTPSATTSTDVVDVEIISKKDEADRDKKSE